MAPPLVNEELKVQLPAIDWLKKSWGYREIKSAEEDDAWGAPIDSLGLMDGRTLLIEVKVAVSGGNVRYNPDRSGSIEGKVARTLNGVFDGRVNYNWPAIRQTWERTHPLVFVLLAKTYTDAGLEEAKDVLRRRSSEWLFDCRIWQWNGAEIRELTRIELNLPPSLEQYDGLRIPTLVEHSDRSRPPSRDQHREEAGRRGLLEIFDYVARRARERGYKMNTTGSGITLVAPGKGRKRESSIGIFVTKSSKRSGMNFGFMSERGDLQWNELPGRPAPKVGAYSMPYRYMSTIDEVEIALRMFAPSL